LPTEVAQFLGATLFHGTSYALILKKTRFGFHFGRFFKNSPGWSPCREESRCLKTESHFVLCIWPAIHTADLGRRQLFLSVNSFFETKKTPTGWAEQSDQVFALL
jgi:hypothetical protein